MAWDFVKVGKIKILWAGGSCGLGSEKFFTLKNEKITSAVFLWFTLLGLFIDRFNILLLINVFIS